MSDYQPVRIDVVSDVVCPWCFIGKRRLEKAIALNPDIPVEGHWRPYFLNDWIPREGISREQYLTTKFGSPERYKGIAQRVSAAASAEGLTYAIDKISRQPNTLDAHRLIRWADGIGKAAEMKQNLMDLYFTEGADLTNHVVLVQAASGMCATDLHGRDAFYPTQFPKVFGHEGAGIVLAVGSAVRHFKSGDHVVMAYPWCGECPNCKTQRQSYCLHAFDLKMNGTRADGSTLHSKNGKPVYSAFFQQSSFGNFTIANERFAVKVRNDAPVEHVCALACGGQTGAGALLNGMKPLAGGRFVVFR